MTFPSWRDVINWPIVCLVIVWFVLRATRNLKKIIIKHAYFLGTADFESSSVRPSDEIIVLKSIISYCSADESNVPSHIQNNSKNTSKRKMSILFSFTPFQPASQHKTHAMQCCSEETVGMRYALSEFFSLKYWDEKREERQCRIMIYERHGDGNNYIKCPRENMYTCMHIIIIYILVWICAFANGGMRWRQPRFVANRIRWNAHIYMCRILECSAACYYRFVWQ